MAKPISNDVVDEVAEALFRRSLAHLPPTPQVVDALWMDSQANRETKRSTRLDAVDVIEFVQIAITGKQALFAGNV